MVRRKLGSLATQDLPAANRNLRRSLGL